MAKPTVSKINLWYKHFINASCPSTFLNRAGAAKKAGYKASSDEGFRSIGSQNYTKLADKIAKWMDEEGLSENTLKLKLISLLEAKETKFFQKDGKVEDQRDVAALETQRRTLDMALKIKGMYEKDNEQQKGNINITVTLEDD